MDYLIKPNAFGLFAEKKNGQAMVSSLTVAEVFEKEHKDVLRAIERLKEDAGKTVANSENLAAQNCAAKLSTDEVDKMFVNGTYKNRGKNYPCYNMTRDGFSLLVMRFTGVKALRWQLEYVKAFNAMENHIREFYDYRMNYPDYTDAIKAHYDRKGKTPQFAYSTEEDMINKLVLGVTAREFKKLNRLDDKEVKSIKPFLTHEQIRMIHKIQTADILLLEEDVPYKERKERLTRLAEKKGWFIGIQPITLPEEIIDK